GVIYFYIFEYYAAVRKTGSLSPQLPEYAAVIVGANQQPQGGYLFVPQGGQYQAVFPQKDGTYVVAHPPPEAAGRMMYPSYQKSELYRWQSLSVPRRFDAAERYVTVPNEAVFVICDMGAVRRVLFLRIGVFLLMVLGFLYQASRVVEQYLSYPSAVDVRIEGTEVLLFPGLSICVTNWISKTKLCELYAEYCDFNSTNIDELRDLLLVGGNLGEIAHKPEDVLQIGFVNPTQYFFEFYLSPK
ncbi:hypothetical protein HPB47_006904, partial [Ixodes persulcatus]